ncbi:MAG: hypothetical protein ACK56I_12745, partial [bacterium]
MESLPRRLDRLARGEFDDPRRSRVVDRRLEAGVILQQFGDAPRRPARRLARAVFKRDRVGDREVGPPDRVPQPRQDLVAGGADILLPGHREEQPVGDREVPVTDRPHRRR